MPECIVCKADYTLGELCPNCRSDNSPWDNWRANQGERRDGTDGLVLSYFVAVLALAFGLIGVGAFWNGVTLAAQLLATAVTVCGCLIVSLAVHKTRYRIREQELLNRVRRGYGALLNDTRLKALVVPALSLLLVLAIAYALVTSDLLWKMAQWWFLDPAYLEQVEQQEMADDEAAEEEQPEEGDGLRKRVRQALPFMLMGTYVASMLSLSYSGSLLLAMAYAREMNQALPQPIFLQEDLLVSVVRRKAERVVDRRTKRRVIGDIGDGEEQNNAEQGVRSWTWDEMERTVDGGIKLKAITEAGRETEENLVGERTERSVYVSYEVEADPWSRITRIARVEGEGT